MKELKKESKTIIMIMKREIAKREGGLKPKKKKAMHKTIAQYCWPMPSPEQ